jgi:hypothetical protein
MIGLAYLCGIIQVLKGGVRADGGGNIGKGGRGEVGEGLELGPVLGGALPEALEEHDCKSREPSDDQQCVKESRWMFRSASRVLIGT